MFLKKLKIELPHIIQQFQSWAYTQKKTIIHTAAAAAAAAKSFQSCPTDSVRPHRRQPPRFPRPWDSPGKNTGVGCHFPFQCMKVKRESEVTQSCLTPATPWTAAHQAPPSMGPSRQEYWSGVPLTLVTKKIPLDRFKLV